MKCPGCQNDLKPHENAQPISILGHKIRPRAFCDLCCKQHPWPAGSAESLERLITGKRDAEATRRVDEATSDWMPPYAGVLSEAAGDPDRIPLSHLADTAPPEDA